MNNIAFVYIQYHHRSQERFLSQQKLYFPSLKIKSMKITTFILSERVLKALSPQSKCNLFTTMLPVP